MLAKWKVLLVAAGMILVSSPASAVEVFFNGVKVTGLRNQSFPSCSVSFDKTGNVHISAKGYSVQRVTQAEATKKGAQKGAQAAPSPGTSAKKTKYKYFLVSTGQSPKASNWDVDVFVNGKWIKKIRGADDQVVVEVSRHLRVGRNHLMFAAVKNYGGKGRLSSSADVYLRVLLGRGTRGGGTVSIEHTVADFRARADQVANFSRSATVLIE